ncbi:hypothetical protein AQUCO_01700544v1 [Aquilegia coerulea]|uniref:Uncharacterized protein n=1 Tax=Aquilegia coerulea TaxID=218851 RepID=A0A2G5DNF7_AQUCA|nr:hypothetical protein AQUCO_01700544v1 [Aquilegia coerulea]
MAHFLFKTLMNTSTLYECLNSLQFTTYKQKRMTRIFPTLSCIFTYGLGTILGEVNFQLNFLHIQVISLFPLSFLFNTSILFSRQDNCVILLV